MKPRYSIEIKANSKHERFSVSYSKHYGDYSSGVHCYDTVEDCIGFIQNHVLKCWSRYDSIAGREPDPVTLGNTHFESVTAKITLPLLLAGQQSLTEWEENNEIAI